MVTLSKRGEGVFVLDHLSLTVPTLRNEFRRLLEAGFNYHDCQLREFSTVDSGRGIALDLRLPSV